MQCNIQNECAVTWRLEGREQSTCSPNFRTFWLVLQVSIALKAPKDFLRKQTAEEVIFIRQMMQKPPQEKSSITQIYQKHSVAYHWHTNKSRLDIPRNNGLYQC